ncbi:MAG: SPFH domain-containing protein [Thermodesulfobacteriota bacterium]
MRSFPFRGFPTFIFVVALAVVLTLYCILHTIETDPGYETVLVDKPYFFGHEGVRDAPQKPGRGWYWCSTTGIDVPTVPIKMDEPFNDLITSNTMPIDFASYLKLRILDGVVLIRNFGGKWYDANIKEQYRTVVRNVARKYSFDAILTRPEVIDQMEADIRQELTKILKSIKIPVVVEDLSLGKATPNGPVMDEINKTAAAQQQKKTQDELAAAQVARKFAEEKRAEADDAYRVKMGWSPSEYLQYMIADMYAKSAGMLIVTTEGTAVTVAPPARAAGKN